MGTTGAYGETWALDLEGRQPYNIYTVSHVGTFKDEYFFPVVFIKFFDKSCKHIPKRDQETILQVPTYFDPLYKVVSPIEMSPHEIENLKQLL